MGDGFAHSIAGGNGKLVVTSVQSPNYDPIAGTGWTINKNGSATFFSISLPGFAAGVKVTFSSTAPPSPNAGDLWYNTAAGLQVSQWNGTAWVPFSIGTGAIASNAITPGLQAIGDTVNPNPYFAGGDLSNWNTTSGVLNFVGIPTSGAIAYPFAGEITCSPGAAFPGIIGTFFAANPGDPVQVNGWFQCNADVQFGIQYYDSAFNFLGENITVVPAGSWQYAQIAGTVIGGATQAVLFVGVNNGSATGSEVIDCTALTVLTKIQGGLIEANTVTAAQIMAGTIIAGAVNGTTITGATLDITTGSGSSFVEVEVDGSTGNITWYKYSPRVVLRQILHNGGVDLTYKDTGGAAQGALLMSIATTAGTALDGTGYGQGVYFHGVSSSAVGMAVVGSQPIVDLAAPGRIHATLNGEVFPLTVNAGAANETAVVTVTSGKEGGDDAAIQLFSQSADGTAAAKMVFEFGGAIWGTLQAATGLIVDTWHNITLDAGWTAGAQAPQYRLLPDGNVQVRGSATHSGVTVSTNINNSNPIPAAYRPAQARIYRPPVSGDTAGTAQIGTNGVLTMRASGFTATQVILDGSYSVA